MKRLTFGFLFFVLAFLGYHAMAQRGPSDLVVYPDTILHNGKIATMDDKSISSSPGTVVQALAIRDGKILAGGANRQILALKGPKTEIIDLRGKTVTPGIIDTHSHLMDYALDHWGGDLPELKETKITGKDWEDVRKSTLDAITKSAEKTGPGKWLQFTLPQYVFKDEKEIAIRVAIRQGFLTRADVDRAAPKNPVILRAGPGAIYNSHADAEFRKQYGDLGDDIVLPGGLIGAVPRRAIQTDIIITDPNVLVSLFKKEQDEWAAYGITTWSSSISAHNVIPAYKKLDQKGEMSIRFAYAPGIHTLSFQGINMLSAFTQMLDGQGSDFLWPIGLATVNMDQSYPGIVSSAEARPEIKAREFDYYIKPGPAGSGEGWRRDLLKEMIKRGFRFSNTHVAGDKTLDVIMDVIEEGSREAGFTPEQIRAKRHASDHCAMNPRPDQIPRLKKLGIIMSCAPKYIVGNSPRIMRDYGEKYTEWVAPVKSLIEGGVRTVLELDEHEIASHGSVFYSLGILINREVGGKVYGGKERIDRVRALKMSTSWAAEYVLRENVLGSLERGKWADLLVLNKDYLSVNEQEVHTVKPLLTMVGGKIVFEDPAFRGKTVGYQPSKNPRPHAATSAE